MASSGKLCGGGLSQPQFPSRVLKRVITPDGEAQRPVGSVGFTPFPKYVTRFHMLMLLWLVVLSRQTLILGSSTPVGPSMISLLAC